MSQLKGPLVEAFNVSGTLRGSAAAIYIDESAYVKEINILSGARLEGDIISRWDPQNELISNQAPENLYTSLTFGRAADAQGNAKEPDPSFSLNYTGNILGKDSIDMSLAAGRLGLWAQSRSTP